MKILLKNRWDKWMQTQKSEPAKLHQSFKIMSEKSDTKILKTFNSPGFIHSTQNQCSVTDTLIQHPRIVRVQKP